jgi:endonuclease YncB( thermonuclease family)
MPQWRYRERDLTLPEVSGEPTGRDISSSSETWALVPGSVYDGNTLRVTDGAKELKIRLCGIDASEKDQPMGVESREHLRSLIDHGDGSRVVGPKVAKIRALGVFFSV